MEDVVLLESKFSSIDLIEDLHKYESVEDQGVVLSLLCSSEGAGYWINNVEGKILVVGISEEAPTTEKQDQKDSDLEDGLSQDVSPHD